MLILGLRTPEGKTHYLAGERPRLAGPSLDARLEREGGAPEQPLHHARTAVSVHLAALAGPGRRADLGHPLRRPAPAQRSPGLPGAQLAARRVSRRDAL